MRLRCRVCWLHSSSDVVKYINVVMLGILYHISILVVLISVSLISDDKVIGTVTPPSAEFRYLLEMFWLELWERVQLGF